MELLLRNVSSDDMDILIEDMPHSDWRLESTPVPDGRRGEIGTAFLVIYCTAAALRAFAAYLVYKANENNGYFETTIETTSETGERCVKTVIIDKRKTGDPSAQAIAEISKLGVDLSALKGS